VVENKREGRGDLIYQDNHDTLAPSFYRILSALISLIVFDETLCSKLQGIIIETEGLRRHCEEQSDEAI
jgi:hypothetical protein